MGNPVVSYSMYTSTISRHKWYRKKLITLILVNTNTNVGVDITNIWIDTEMQLEHIKPHGTQWNFVDLHGHVSQFNAVQKSLQKVPRWIIFQRLSGIPASSKEEWGRRFATKTGSSQQLINKNSVDAAGATVFIRTAQHFLRKRKAENSVTGFSLLLTPVYFPHCGKMNTLNTSCIAFLSSTDFGVWQWSAYLCPWWQLAP